MSSLYRRDIPLALVFIVGLCVLLNYFFVFDPLGDLVSLLMNFGTIIIGFLYAVGGISLIIYEYRQYNRLQSNDPTKWLSLYTIVMIFAFFVFGLTNATIYSWLVANVQGGAGVGINAVTGCAIVLAAFRSFRVRSVDATVLLIAGVITMFELAPIGEVISPVIPPAGLWLLEVLTRAANRGMQIGLGVGGVYTAIRTWLGMERRALGV
jgi:hypothetical protein